MKSILRELLADEAPISGAYLAKLNQVTPRTTRQDIKKLGQIMVENGASIKSIMGKGYKLDITDDQAFRDFLKITFTHDESNSESIPRSPEERITYIIKRLLLSEGYIKLEDLADEIYISKSTIQNDIKEVKQVLAKYEIMLESRPNYGLKVKGSELKLRFCMSEYVFDRNDPITEVYLDSISQEELGKVSEIIMRKIKLHQITLSDIAMNNLVIHILIAYKRIKSGYHVTLYKQDLQEVTGQYEYQVAKEIVKEIENAFQVTFPEVEVAYIAVHLLGTNMLSQSSELIEQVMDQKILDIVSNALDKVEEELQLGIKDDKELTMALRLHLKPAINRFKYGMNIRNPMLEDIKKNYPLAFEAGVIASIAIEEQTLTKIDENEVGYLALHIGSAIERRKLRSGPKRCLIVCASGLGTSQLIYYKLKSQFGQNLDVMGTTEYYRLSQYNLQEIDFIVSSIPIPKELPIPVIEVNAIVGDSDISKIENLLVEEEQQAENYIQADLTFLRKQLDSMEEVLEFMNQQLLERNLVDATFLEAILEREKVAPTSFGNLVAIPHPITPQSEQTFLAICTLEKPINWHDKPVQFICVLCVKKNSQEDLKAMYKRLGKIIDNRALVQRLVKAKTFEDVLKVFKGN